MSTRNDKAGSPLPPTKTLTDQQLALTERLCRLEDKLRHLHACHHFHHAAVYAMTDPECFDENELWRLGLFLHQRWLAQLGEELSRQLVLVREQIPSHQTHADR